MKLELETVGIIHTPYKEKFAVPRQPGLVSAAKAQLILSPPFDEADALRGLEQFSHVWLIFAFHETMGKGWSPTVRPPRLGGNERLGVFATRSTFRPNPLGLSVAKLDSITIKNNQCILNLSGIDLVDGTPILDIKPYVPYADSLPDAQAGYATDAPIADMPVTFTDEALNQIAAQRKKHPELQTFIAQVLAQDPRPAYKKNKTTRQEYGVKLYDFNVRWTVEDNITTVFSVIKTDTITTLATVTTPTKETEPESTND
ncbi:MULTISPECIES: tRNA (N6-threonylcarbamoyladenosine(37)-N6)-methyltransferase TrmO [unclassified Moritella]|uniref:tRNA (N6-threonylcarbamoyladenosine(37)-N6)-methyltransferase TrmO n=1 Tax=unclassified Moritella TaxID=2637987 RepID=UPI001BA663C8|nr:MULTISPECIES: tRNA (N6-threonylcarbamoyladenosine(37)-N6)-methyltransferase TrmO [unclassified Moritella]QUM82293.1 tRNA (N6-threonylcarbamoyladenosine(37)-N6)-methyltransferase TrmO [Moritella sp. 5]QUM86593.1 tRNA (N6-threonylcarbamoyladenosine(37)-N6)-methyltransferase TrmO [Moritella sp. 28]QUM90821.1 tRNA (N6-threonylcarbamoyladenosine(37)-N6)-methyltransferase TrmO [Moritella sp. 36]